MSQGDHLLSVGRRGSVAGGKLTTHRRIASMPLRHLPTLASGPETLLSKPLFPAPLPTMLTWTVEPSIISCTYGSEPEGSNTARGARQRVEKCRRRPRVGAGRHGFPNALGRDILPQNHHWAAQLTRQSSAARSPQFSNLGAKIPPADFRVDLARKFTTFDRNGYRNAWKTVVL